MCSDKVMLGLMSASEHQAIFTWDVTLSTLDEKYDFIWSVQEAGSFSGVSLAWWAWIKAPCIAFESHKIIVLDFIYLLNISSMLMFFPTFPNFSSGPTSSNLKN